MNCVRCGHPLEQDGLCKNCGVEHKYIQKACATADYLYNQGLEKAKIRNLSGAAEDIRRALSFNKYHTKARNLLGLILFETGEAAEAIAQWTVSVQLDEKDPLAAGYLNKVQQDAAYMNDVNQTIKKYNLALHYAKQGSEDLAFIQIKKVLSLTPNFVKGHLLLALLYLHAKDQKNALSHVKNVLKIDAYHPIAMMYYQELSPEKKKLKLSAPEKKEEKAEHTEPEKPISKPIGAKGYKEPKTEGNKVLMSIVIGIVIGVVAMWVLVMPNQKFNVSSDYKKLQIEFDETVAAKDSTIDQLEKDKKSLEKENKELTAKLEVYTGKDGEDGMYDAILKASSEYAKGDTIAAAKALLIVEEDRLDSDTAKNMYKTLKANTFNSASSSLYSQGYSAYNSYKYQDALELFKDAYKLNKDNIDAYYFLGRCYDRLGKYEKAKEVYEKIIEKYPNSSRVKDATNKLNALQ